MEMPNQYETKVGERGMGLSGGRRDRERNTKGHREFSRYQNNRSHCP
jgi:hypothetical protein